MRPAAVAALESGSLMMTEGHSETGWWVYRWGLGGAHSVPDRESQTMVLEAKPQCSRLSQGCPHAQIPTSDSANHRNRAKVAHMGGLGQPAVIST